MKNSLKKLLALVLVLSMAFCFAACDDEKKTENSTPNSAEEQIQAYIDSQQEDIDAAIEAIKAQGEDVKVYAKDSALVYEYKINQDIPESSIADFEASVEDTRSELESSAKEVFDECEAVEEVVYIYYDVDGTKLCELTIER